MQARANLTTTQTTTHCKGENYPIRGAELPVTLDVVTLFGMRAGKRAQEYAMARKMRLISSAGSIRLWVRDFSAHT